MMIKNFVVRNFKSIKYLSLDCKRINIFIGKPNTGKSNILESIGIFSLPYGNLKDFVRFENMIDLFYDHNLEEKIEIRADDKYCEIKFENGSFKCKGVEEDKNIQLFEFTFNYTDYTSKPHTADLPFKFYRFAALQKFPSQKADYLLPPKGENLFFILFTNKTLRKMVKDIFDEYNFKVIYEPHPEQKIKIQKEIEDTTISYPYFLTSDTLQRVVFHLLAIETNKDSIIIFEEPEIHSFPYYTKFLAERIALSRTNQYFISTHNPYFLLSVLEKAPKGDIGIFITYFKDYQTKVKLLTEKQLHDVLDLDASVFFNLDQFLEEE